MLQMLAYTHGLVPILTVACSDDCTTHSVPVKPCAQDRSMTCHTVRPVWGAYDVVPCYTAYFTHDWSVQCISCI